jgi:hypothetical protein
MRCISMSKHYVKNIYTLHKDVSSKINSFPKKRRYMLEDICRITGIGINKIRQEFMSIYGEYKDTFCPIGFSAKMDFSSNIFLGFFSFSSLINDGRYLFFSLKAFKRYLKTPKKTLSIHISEKANETLSRKEMQYLVEWWASKSTEQRGVILRNSAINNTHYPKAATQ